MKSPREQTRKPDTDDIASMKRSILVALRRIIRAVDLHSHKLMEEHGLTGPQLAALQEIVRRGTASARDLAQSLQVSQPTITGILDRLERGKLITRARNGSDRRAIDVTITEAGQRLLTAAPPLLQERFSEELAKLETWEQTMILATLQRVASMMDAERLPAAPLLVTGPDPVVDLTSVILDRRC
jgi:DNA-binding MarR family transcriptional regulator